MKDASKLWWLACLALIVSWFFYQGAESDVANFRKSQNSIGGLATSFVHGLVLDYEHVGRVADRDQKLVDRAILWQNVFRFSLLASLVFGGAAIYYAAQSPAVGSQ